MKTLTIGLSMMLAGVAAAQAEESVIFQKQPSQYEEMLKPENQPADSEAER